MSSWRLHGGSSSPHSDESTSHSKSSTVKHRKIIDIPEQDEPEEGEIVPEKLTPSPDQKKHSLGSPSKTHDSWNQLSPTKPCSTETNSKFSNKQNPEDEVKYEVDSSLKASKWEDDTCIKEAHRGFSHKRSSSIWNVEDETKDAQKSSKRKSGSRRSDDIKTNRNYTKHSHRSSSRHRSSDVGRRDHRTIHANNKKSSSSRRKSSDSKKIDSDSTLNAAKQGHRNSTGSSSLNDSKWSVQTNNVDATEASGSQWNAWDSEKNNSDANIPSTYKWSSWYSKESNVISTLDDKRHVAEANANDVLTLSVPKWDSGNSSEAKTDTNSVWDKLASETNSNDANKWGSRGANENKTNSSSLNDANRSSRSNWESWTFSPRHRGSKSSTERWNSGRSNMKSAIEDTKHVAETNAKDARMASVSKWDSGNSSGTKTNLKWDSCNLKESNADSSWDRLVAGTDNKLKVVGKWGSWGTNENKANSSSQNDANRSSGSNQETWTFSPRHGGSKASTEHWNSGRINMISAVEDAKHVAETNAKDAMTSSVSKWDSRNSAGTKTDSKWDSCNLKESNADSSWDRLAAETDNKLKVVDIWGPWGANENKTNLSSRNDANRSSRSNRESWTFSPTHGGSKASTEHWNSGGSNTKSAMEDTELVAETNAEDARTASVSKWNFGNSTGTKTDSKWDSGNSSGTKTDSKWDSCNLKESNADSSWDRLATETDNKLKVADKWGSWGINENKTNSSSWNDANKSSRSNRESWIFSPVHGGSKASTKHWNSGRSTMKSTMEVTKHAAKTNAKDTMTSSVSKWDSGNSIGTKKDSKWDSCNLKESNTDSSWDRFAAERDTKPKCEDKWVYTNENKTNSSWNNANKSSESNFDTKNSSILFTPRHGGSATSMKDWNSRSSKTTSMDDRKWESGRHYDGHSSGRHRLYNNGCNNYIQPQRRTWSDSEHKNFTLPTITPNKENSWREKFGETSRGKFIQSVSESGCWNDTKDSMHSVSSVNFARWGDSMTENEGASSSTLPWNCPKLDTQEDSNSKKVAVHCSTINATKNSESKNVYALTNQVSAPVPSGMYVPNVEVFGNDQMTINAIKNSESGNVYAVNNQVSAPVPGGMYVPNVEVFGNDQMTINAMKNSESRNVYAVNNQVSAPVPSGMYAPNVEVFGNDQMTFFGRQSSDYTINFTGVNKVNANDNIKLPPTESHKMAKSTTHYWPKPVDLDPPLIRNQASVKSLDVSVQSPSVAGASKNNGSIGISGSETVEGTNEDIGILMFKSRIADFAKDTLRPHWKGGHLTEEEHNTIVKKVVNKVMTTLEQKIMSEPEKYTDLYISCNRIKLTNLVAAYLEILEHDKMAKMMMTPAASVQ